MGRPRTALGTAGKITTVGQVNIAGRWVTAPAGVKPTRYRSRARLRGSNGVLRGVERFDRTKGKAETKLRVALTQEAAESRGDALRSDMSLVDAGLIWLAQAERLDSGLAQSTKEQYRSAFGRYVHGSGIAGLTLREVNRVPPLRTFVQQVADANGTGSAKTARTVVSNIIGMAVNDGVLEHNAMRQVPPARANTKGKRPMNAKRAGLLGDAEATDRDTSRAFTRVEREKLLDFAASYPLAQDRDVVDLLRCRHGRPHLGGAGPALGRRRSAGGHGSRTWHQDGALGPDLASARVVGGGPGEAGRRGDPALGLRLRLDADVRTAGSAQHCSAPARRLRPCGVPVGHASQPAPHRRDADG
jgi:hypothetical protein